MARSSRRVAGPGMARALAATAPRAGTALAAAAGVCVALAAPTAYAGIVNVQSILATKVDEGLSGSITGSVDWRTGNSERLILSLAPVASYRHGRHLILGYARGDLGRSGDLEFDRKTFEHVRYRMEVTPLVTIEAFGQHEFDELKSLELRALAGAGARLQLLSGSRLRAGLGVAYMFEYEQLDEDRGALEPDEVNPAYNHRVSSYLTGSYEVDDRLQLVQTVYAQPLLTGPSDIRLLTESQVVVKLSQRLSLTTSFVLAYDSDPPDYADDANDIEGTDTALKTAITYTF